MPWVSLPLLTPIQYILTFRHCKALLFGLRRKYASLQSHTHSNQLTIIHGSILIQENRRLRISMFQLKKGLLLGLLVQTALEKPPLLIQWMD